MNATTRLLVAFGAMALPTAGMAEMTGPTIMGTRLDISSRGEVLRTPDVAVISAGVVTQSIDARTAMSTNATAMAQVIAALRKAGVAEKDIATSQIGLSPQYRYVENRAPLITGYQASNSVTIRFRDILRSGAILDALVAAGANQINGPTMMLDKPQAAFDEARLEAMKAARARAEIYAHAAGLSVKRIVSISESGDTTGPRPMVMMMARGAEAMAKTEVLPGEQEISVSVAVTFELG